MGTSHKHQPINLQQVLNAFDHTIIVTEQLGWKHQKHEMLKMQRTHDLIQQIFENNILNMNEKIDEVAEMVLHYYQEELALAKASDTLDFARKINQRNNNLHYARMLALILRDLSPKIDSEELNKHIKARHLEMIREIPHDLFYDTSPVKETTKTKALKQKDYTIHKARAVRAKSKTKAATVKRATKTAKGLKAKSVKKTVAKKPVTKKLQAKTRATKAVKAVKVVKAVKTVKAAGKVTKPRLK